MNYQALKTLRESKNMTQAQLAEKSGLSDKTIRDLETGRNTNPTQSTLDTLCHVLCPNSPEDFWEAIKDTPDYAREKALLENDKKHLPGSLVHPLSRLLDESEKNSVSYAIACLCGYLRGGSGQAAIRNHAITLLDAFASAVQTAQTTQEPLELEAFTRYLIRDFESLINIEGVPKHKIEKGAELISALQHSRTANLSCDRASAIRAIFYWVYDSWESIRDVATTYEIISHIFILLDNAKDNTQMRKELFFATLNHFYQVNYSKSLS